DKDPNKRRKVIDWLLADEPVRVYLAKKLNVPADRIQIVRVDTADGLAELAAVVTLRAHTDRVVEAAFTADGKLLATTNAGVSNTLIWNSDGGLTGTVVLNERTFDTVTRRVNVNQAWALKLAADANQPSVAAFVDLADPPAVFEWFFLAQPAEPKVEEHYLRLW